MGNWFRSRKSSTAPRKQISYRPRLEGLEDRNLMSVTIDPILDKSVAVGQSLVVPFTATDTDGNALTYTITSNNPSVTTKLHTGNTFMTVTVAGFGDMTFELFNDETPMTVAKITALIVGTINTNKPFYDGLTFHRVVPDFVIQGGDPKGDGTGGFNGTGYPFADEFKSDLIYTGDGQLGMANSGPWPPPPNPDEQLAILRHHRESNPSQ